MATKPTLENARWGETTGGTPGGNQTAPTSGQRDSGFVLNAAMVSSFFNALFRQWYLWAKYLSEGILSGDHQFLDDVDVDGALNSDGLITAGAGATAGANQHFTVSGTGRYKRGSLTRKIAGSGGVEGSTPGSGVFNEGAYSNNSAGNNYIIALQADVGERLTSVNARIFSSAAGDVVMTVRSVSNTGTSTTLGTATSVGPFANENLVVSGLTADVADDDVYLIVKFAFNSTTGVVRGVRWITNVP